MASLSDIPFLSGYMQQGQLNRQNELGDLRQASGVQSLMANMNAQRQAEQEQAEMEKIKPLLAQAGGPEKASQMLIATGNEKLMALGIKLRSSLPQPDKPQLVTTQRPEGPMQSWLRPGESTGVDVGLAPKDVAAEERIRTQVEIAKQRSEDQRLSRQEQLEARKELIRLTASLRQPPQPRQTEPLVQIIGPDGQAQWAERKDAIGKPSASGGLLNNTMIRERQIAGDLEKVIKPHQDVMNAYQRYEQIRTTGDNSGANNFLAQQLTQMSKTGQRAIPKAELERILGSGDLGNDWMGRAGNMVTQMVSGVRTPSVDKRMNDLADAMAKSSAQRIGQEIQNVNARLPSDVKAERVVGAKPRIYGRYIVTPTGKMHSFASSADAQAALDNASKVVGQ